jgi:hypothetical protein
MALPGATAGATGASGGIDWGQIVGQGIGGLGSIIGSAVGGRPAQIPQQLLSMGGQLGGQLAGQLTPALPPGIGQVLTDLSGRVMAGNAVPFTVPDAQALRTLLSRQLQAPLEQHNEAAGRAIVNRTKESIQPVLSAIKGQLDHRAAQVQATGEHRAIEAEQAFQRYVRSTLATILQRLDARRTY